MASSRRSVPSIATLRTHSSILAMSVSLSHGLTSRRMEDLATSAGFLDAYSDRRCSRIRAASALSSSSSEPKRSMSSSLLLFGEAGGAVHAPPGLRRTVTLFGLLSFSPPPPCLPSLDPLCSQAH
uniref:Uncharacterized protein n=1 Tax=Poecilia latipinna TaxID=48699 RepID=A0A3B3V0E2_9TELE